MMLYVYSESDCSRWLNSLQTTTVEYMLKQLNNFNVSSLTILDTQYTGAGRGDQRGAPGCSVDLLSTLSLWSSPSKAPLDD